MDMKTITTIFCVRRILLSMLLVCAFSASSTAQLFPLKVHSSGRYLVDHNESPVFLNGDAAWSLIVQPNFGEASQYLNDRAARGFNTILVNLIENNFADNAPANIAGVPPFTGTAFATPNEAYFAHADSVIALAHQLDIIVLLAPIYLGYDCGNEGWCSDVQTASIADMKSWGQYVGNRYKGFPNIIWVIGGDTDPTPVRAKVDSMVAALKAADVVYPDRIITAHGSSGIQVLQDFPESWLSLNNTYTWTLTEVVSLAEVAYAHSPVLPFVFMEGRYENSTGINDQQLRAQAYWTFLRGAVGNVFGNNPIWYFGSDVVSGNNEDWIGYLGSSGSVAMSHFGDLVNSRHWFSLIPDMNGTVLTAGAQSGLDQAVVAYASDSTCIIGYMPTRRTVTINPTVLSGNQVHVQWYNPSTGLFTDAGIVPRATGNYTPPLNRDWVLVIDAILTAPQPPTLDSPIDGSVGAMVIPTLAWIRSPSATSYRVQISTDSGFTAPVLDDSTLSNYDYEASGLSYSTTYFWRVSASNVGGVSDFSNHWSFSTEGSAGCCVGVRGNVNNDPLDEISISDLTYLVSFMFKNGPPPPCDLEADINGSADTIDIADLVYLKNYMFMGSVAPQSCPMSDTIGSLYNMYARRLASGIEQ